MSAKLLSRIFFVVAFAIPVFAADQQPLYFDRQDAYERTRTQPPIDASSDKTLIIEYSAGMKQVHVVAKTDSLLEESYSPIGEDLVDGPHAVFVLRSGQIIVKGALYRWTDANVLQIAVPYSDQWNVKNVFLDGLLDQLGRDAVGSFSFSGEVLRDEGTGAPEFVLSDSRPDHLGRIAPQSETCIALGGGACGVGADGEDLHGHQCYSCWWNFCRAPRNKCM